MTVMAAAMTVAVVVSGADHHTVDVAVYDASSGGVTAAIAASRHGADTLLICASWPACWPEGGLRVGGMSSGGLGETDLGSCSDAIGGIALEFYTRNRQHYGQIQPAARAAAETAASTSSAAAAGDCRLPAAGCNQTFNLEPHVALGIFEAMLREANVTVIYGEQVTSVDKDGTTVTQITLTNGTTVAARVFVEASYEADLIARAGVSYIVGRESNTTYNESLNGNTGGLRGNQFTRAVDPYWPNGTILPHVAHPPYGKPGDGDSRVQAYNFRLCVSTDLNNSVAVRKPEGYNPADWELLRRLARADREAALGCGSIPGGPKCDMNNGGGLSTDFIGASWDYPEADYAKRRVIWEAHKRYTQGYLWTVANDPALAGTAAAAGGTRLCADEFNETGHWPPALYVRAARRLRGPKVFTQNTPKEQHVAGPIGNLSIGIGCYNFDSHNAQRMACLTKVACNGRGPTGVGDDQPYAWDEGDVQIGPGRYQIPIWVTMPHSNETTNVIVIASPSASHIGMSTLRMEPQFMIVGHSVGVAAAMAAANSRRGPAVVSEIDVDLLHAKLLADGQILLPNSAPHPPSPPANPLSVCELDRCFGVDVNAAKLAPKVYHGATCGKANGSAGSTGASLYDCTPLLPDEWLANQDFWTKNTTVGLSIFATGDTFLKKSTVSSHVLPTSMIKPVRKGASCTVLNGKSFADYVLCSSP